MMLAIVHPVHTRPSNNNNNFRPVTRKPRPSALAHSTPPQPTVTHDPPPIKQHPPAPAPAPPLDIHSYPAPDLLRLLASLLAQIAATNDALAPPSPVAPRNAPPSAPHPDAPLWRSLTTASRASFSTPSATLTFHARNIPTISLEAYLLRILKYCPTTNEVFLSLLVYFDRMSRLCAEATGRSFVIDSYNIHRLVIAGVTVASKFFSDVFYTNSRYAKVGGLPQAELNQLELQFLLLNDFRLVIPADEMQRYAEQLILFSASASPPPSLLPTSSPAPIHTMGAIDAYAGRIPAPDHPRFTPPASGQHTVCTPPRRVRTASFASTDSQSSAYSDAETGTEDGDADETTDDEPTIRPTYSRAGSCAGADDDDDDDDDNGGVDRRMGTGVRTREEGERTPETHARGRGAFIGPARNCP